VSALSIAEIGEIEKREEVVLAENGAAHPRYSTQSTLSQEAERGRLFAARCLSSLARPHRPPRLDSQAAAGTSFTGAALACSYRFRLGLPRWHVLQSQIADDREHVFATSLLVRLHLTRHSPSWKCLELGTLQLTALWLVLTVPDQRTASTA